MPDERPNFLHVDLKGILPSAAMLLRWIDFIADIGFNGIVWEYEDRLPWQTWPDAFRAGLSLEQWRSVWSHCRRRGLEVVPLVQVQGHLEWLLKHERYAGWRENGCFNELCPRNSDATAAVRAWLDEVVRLHPDSRYVHIGADETWNLATCPDCSAAAAGDADGPMGVYVEHVASMAEQVLSRGASPMIWADMFWRKNRLDLVKRLPAQVILCDWQYKGAGPWDTTGQLAGSGRVVFGASAVRCNFNLSESIGPLQARIDNIAGWRGQACAGLIHTTWGRSRSLTPLYGPWHGWLPAIIAAGDPERWAADPLASWPRRLDKAIDSVNGAHAGQLRDELEQIRFDDPMREQCRRWWTIALQRHVDFMQAVRCSFTAGDLESVHRHVGMDPDSMHHVRAALTRCLNNADEWESSVRRFFADNELDSVEEYLASRLTHLRRTLRRDWARDVIPARRPVSAK